MLTFVLKGVKIEVEDAERTEVEVWDRVMGYFRPVSDWNIGKQEEHKDRIRFSEDLALSHCITEPSHDALESNQRDVSTETTDSNGKTGEGY